MRNTENLSFLCQQSWNQNTFNSFFSRDQSYLIFLHLKSVSHISWSQCFSGHTYPAMMIHSEVFTHPTWAESALYFTINVGAVLFVFLNVFYYVVLTFFLSIFFRSFSFSFFRPLLLLQVGKLIIGALPSVTFSFFSCDDKARFKILS